MCSRSVSSRRRSPLGKAYAKTRQSVTLSGFDDRSNDGKTPEDKAGIEIIILDGELTSCLKNRRAVLVSAMTDTRASAFRLDCDAENIAACAPAFNVVPNIDADDIGC